MPKKADTERDFETLLRELEQIVERMERGEISLEQSLEDFERGMTLARACQGQLKDAEQRVEKVLRRNNELQG
ncbi:MAG: exodeoxyribonuclease VII small subunit, partial [Gammaproteobacteria bacterium]|nr:exodeoxyribonuclease VII small subunit [Gammaproteobacteria bacterium]